MTEPKPKENSERSVTDKSRDIPRWRPDLNEIEMTSNPSPLREERTEPKVGSPAHRKKFPARYGTRYTSRLDQVAYPIPGTAPSEKGEDVSDYGPVTYDKKTGYPNKATPEQVAATAYRLEKARQMTGTPDKPKLKKTNPYNNLKISIPNVNFARLRNPEDEMRKAAEDRIRVAAFTPKRDPDLDRGVGSLKDNIAKKLRAAESKSDWKKRNTTTYKG